jgi:hypothetical protein
MDIKRVELKIKTVYLGMNIVSKFLCKFLLKFWLKIWKLLDNLINS